MLALANGGSCSHISWCKAANIKLPLKILPLHPALNVSMPAELFNNQNYLSFIISMPAELFNYRYLISVHVELISYRSLLLHRYFLNYSITGVFHYQCLLNYSITLPVSFIISVHAELFNYQYLLLYHISAWWTTVFNYQYLLLYQCLLNHSITSIFYYIGACWTIQLHYRCLSLSVPAELFNYRYLLLYQCLQNYSISGIFYYISACWTIQLYWYFLLYLCLLDYSNTCIIGIILLWRHLRKKIFFGKHVVWSAAEIRLVTIK